MVQSNKIKMLPLELNRYDDLTPYYARYNSDIHDLNLTNLMIWRKKHNLHTLELGGYLWIVYKPGDPFDTIFSEPIGDYEDDTALDSATDALRQYCRENDFAPILRHIGSTYLSHLEASGVRFNAKSMDDEFDYCYLSEKLATLSGNAYHKKKNHLNQFHRHYNERYRIESISESNAGVAFQAVKAWCISNGCGNSLDLCYEFQGIFEILSTWKIQETHGMEGVVIFLNDQAVAVSFGEFIVGDTFLVHVEKADHNVQGIYTAINQAMAQQVYERCTVINREQDLGLEGLRKAKLSYHPHHMVKKFNVVFE